jgi:hypothetical protein
LMWESGEPMEFGIIDFYRVFSRALGEGGMGQRGLEWKVGDVAPSLPLRTGSPRHPCALGVFI